MSKALSLREEIFRKFIHLSSVWMVAFIAVFEKDVSIMFFAALLILFFLFEYVRMQNGCINQFLLRYFSFVMRDHEQVHHFEWRALTGSFYFLLAVLCCVILFDKSIAIAGILIMIFSDTAAALVGKKIGKMRVPYVPEKTIEGVCAYFAVTFCILYVLDLVSIVWIPLIALASAMVETYSHKFHVNDNLSITLTTSGFIWLVITFG